MDWLLLLVNVVTMYLSGQLALRRGRSLKNWLWLGAIFGPFALVTVALLPPHQKAAIS
jgi:hypothetical protein